MPETGAPLAPPLAQVLPHPGADIVLRLRGLGFVAGGTPLLRDVTFAVRTGRALMVLGANGAGKSVLLRLMHGLITPTDGQILWQGRPLDKAARARQAMVFQRPVLLRRSARGNLRFALAVQGVPRAERAARIEASLDRAGLHALAHRPARELSGGEQQRLALARALICRPDLLFLDEPTASLDPAATLAIEAQLIEARREGVTLVMVTHDRGQARRLADDLVFLHEGRVAETGPAARVLERPRSAAVRAWLDGRLHLGDGPPP